MADITNSTFFTNAYSTLNSLLVNNITDPKNRFKTPIIKNRRQFPSDQRFTGYPYIVLHPLEMVQDREVNDRSKAQITYFCTIEVFGDVTDLSSFDSLSDQLPSIFNNITHQNTLRDAGLKMGRIESSPAIPDFDDEKEIFVRTFTIPFVNLLDTR